MKIIKLCFSLIFIIIFILSCNGSISESGHCNIEYDNSNKMSSVETFSDGKVFISNNNYTLSILENTTIIFNDNENYNLKHGIVFFNKKITSAISQKLFGINIWGGAQFYRIALPSTFRHIKSDVNIIYISKKGKEIQKTVLDFLYTKHNHNYFGFFIPFSTYSDATKYIIEINIYKGKILGKIKYSQKINKKEWGKQTIYFRKGKSKNTHGPDMKKFWKEHKIRKEIWKENNLFKFLLKGFDYPLDKNNRITSDFGLRRIWRYTNGKFIRQNIHKGIDFGRKIGTPVYSPANGIVLLVMKDSEFYGNNIIIDHGYSVFSNYAHLSKIVVKVGQKVKKGQLIGLVGMTGNVTGPHLHWETRIYGKPIDPRSLLHIKDIYTE